MKQKFILIVLMFLPFHQAWADTHIVTQAGAGGNPPTEYSIAEFNALTGTGFAGDYFFFSGTFTTPVKPIGLSGTASGGYVTLDGWQGGTCNPVADRGAPNSATFDLLYDQSESYNTNYCFTIRQCSYLIVQDFNVTDSFTGIYATGNVSTYASHVIIRRNYIHNTWGTGIQVSWNTIDGGSGGGGINYLTIGGALGDGNFLWECLERPSSYTHDLGVAKSSDCIVSYNEVGRAFVNQDLEDSSNGIAIHTGNRQLIEYNTVYYPNGQNGICFKETGGVDKICRFNHVYGSGQQGGWSPITNQGQQKDFYVYGNNFHDGGSGIFLYRWYENIHIWANIIADSVAETTGPSGEQGTGTGIDVSAEAGVPQEDVWIYNNTFLRNDVEGYRVDARAGGIGYYGQANVLTKNNIFAWNRRDDDDQQWGAWSGFNLIDSDYNLFYSDDTIGIHYNGAQRTLAYMIANTALETHSKEENPLFVNAIASSGTNVRLSVESPAINDGVDLSGLAGSMTVQGITYNMYYDDCLDPNNTDWTTSPPTVATIKQDAYGSWEKGAYVYRGGKRKIIIIN